STKSTKLTVDIGSQQVLLRPSQPSPTYSHLSTASFCLSNDDYQDTTLSTQGHTQYMEINSKPRRQ
ncbi:hypothetical protein M9458_022116, partial [Cirrhinus mrigala]